jgi:peptidyl-prolyl cis-trans isomerase SurA
MRLALALLLALAAGAANAQTAAPDVAGKPDTQPAPDGVKASAVSKPVLVDRIVAVVNAEVITQRDLAERVELVISQLKRQGTAIPDQSVLAPQVLERLIMDRLQVQFANQTGVRVEDLQVDRMMTMVAEQNKMTLADFRKSIEARGVPIEKVREDMRNEMLISRLREREVDNKIQVGESDIDNFLQDLQSGDAAGAQYEISHILVRVPEHASPEQINARLRRAEDAHKRALAGEDFARLAVSYSDAPDALQGGDMGWRERDRLPEIFVSTLPTMKPGDVSDILRSPAGFHILKLADRRGGATTFVVEQTHVRHILARINELVSEAEARRKITLLRQRIVEGSNFSELARLNSDDTASATRGGDLGWTVSGDLVAEFDQAMRDLKIGELSQPVRSPFGYHLIEVLERRTADLSADRKRIEARRILRDRRSDEAYQEWLRQLRDRAFVDLRLEDR